MQLYVRHLEDIIDELRMPDKFVRDETTYSLFAVQASPTRLSFMQVMAVPSQ